MHVVSNFCIIIIVYIIIFHINNKYLIVTINTSRMFTNIFIASCSKTEL